MSKHSYKNKSDRIDAETLNDKELLVDLLAQGLVRLSQIDESKLIDRDVVLAGIHRDIGFFKKLPPIQRNDKEICRIVFSKSPRLFYLFGEDVRNDREMCRMAIEFSPAMFEYFGEDAKSDKSFLIELLYDKFIKLSQIEKIYPGSGNAVAEWIRGDINVFKRLPERIRNDKKILISLLQNGFIKLSQVGERFLSDRDVVLAGIRGDVGMFKRLPEKLRNDRVVCMIAVWKSPRMFDFFGYGAKKDETLIADYLFHDETWGSLSGSDKRYYLAILGLSKTKAETVSNIVNLSSFEKKFIRWVIDNPGSDMLLQVAESKISMSLEGLRTWLSRHRLRLHAELGQFIPHDDEFDLLLKRHHINRKGETVIPDDDNPYPKPSSTGCSTLPWED